MQTPPAAPLGDLIPVWLMLFGAERAGAEHSAAARRPPQVSLGDGGEKKKAVKTMETECDEDKGDRSWSWGLLPSHPLWLQ